MGLSSTPLPPDRVRLVNPGERVRVGNRMLRAFKPPVYDNAVTTGFYDETSSVLFSADCFGALLPDVPQSAADISDADLRDGQTLWVTIDSPWIHNVDRKLFTGHLAQIGRARPRDRAQRPPSTRARRHAQHTARHTRESTRRPNVRRTRSRHARTDARRDHRERCRLIPYCGEVRPPATGFGRPQRAAAAVAKHFRLSRQRTAHCMLELEERGDVHAQIHAHACGRYARRRRLPQNMRPRTTRSVCPVRRVADAARNGYNRVP